MVRPVQIIPIITILKNFDSDRHAYILVQIIPIITILKNLVDQFNQICCGSNNTNNYNP